MRNGMEWVVVVVVVGSGWVESTCFPLEEGLQYLPPTRARACVRACACECVSRGTRLHSLIFLFLFFFAGGELVDVGVFGLV